MPIPQEIEADLRHATRLEYWTLFWLVSIVAVMGVVMGSSQAMKSAWIEDLLSMLPATVFLIATRFEQREPDNRFRYGYDRVNSLAFVVASVALLAVGAFLLVDSLSTLLKQEHPTIGPITLFGTQIWLGWLMIAALIYSVVPPLILGRLKLPVATRIQDKVLHTDAQMQKADWLTGLAGVAGILGVGFGLWWADAAAAGFISFEILRDGLRNVRIATAELVDGMPRALGHDEIAADAMRLERQILQRYPAAIVRMRESGRYIIVQIVTSDPLPTDPMAGIELPDRSWRVRVVSTVRSQLREKA